MSSPSPFISAKSASQSIRLKIFVKGVNWIGDAIIATPALAHLRATYPDAEITLMVRPWVEPVYLNNPDIDRLWVHDDSASMKSFAQAVRRIRAERFQIGYALPNSPRSALLLLLGGVRERVGYGGGARGWALNRSVEPAEEDLDHHQVFFYLKLVEQAGGKCRRVALKLAPGDLEASEVDRLLQQEGVAPGAPLIGIAPGSINSNAKRWMPERFAQLADRISTEMGAEVLLLGSGKERDVLDRVASACHEPVYNMGGKINLSQSIALMQRMEGLICNDSGAMHIAAAMHVPTVAIFGPTEINTTYPFSAQALIVRKQGLECMPCMLRECPVAGHPCMSGIEVDHVFDALCRVRRRHRDTQAHPAIPTYHEMLVHV